MANSKTVRKTIELADELGYAYREYAHYTLLDRAIADVRDGFKPVHRRIAYAMGDVGLGPMRLSVNSMAQSSILGSLAQR